MILVGSTYFFKDIKGFQSKDTDWLELVEIPISFKDYMQLTGKNKCIFRWRKMNADEFVKITLKYKLPMSIGKFLIPEFCKEVGIEIYHLLQLQPLVEALDDKHKYEQIIWKSYIKNNDFILTKEQLIEAYNEYKKYR